MRPSRDAPVAELPVESFSERIAEYWKKFPTAINAALLTSLQNQDLKEAAEQLHDAEFLSRLLDSGAVPAWDNLPFGPAEGVRRFRLHELFLQQAQRTIEAGPRTPVSGACPFDRRPGP